MSAERQLYLYDKIRQVCASEADAALTCPSNTVAVCPSTASGGTKKSARL